MPSGIRHFWKALTANPAVIESLQNRTANFNKPLGGTNVSNQMRAAYQRMQAATYAWMYMNQPAVRAVVDLIAENVSQLGLKLYERVDENEREPDPEHPAAQTMRYPNAVTPADLFVSELVSDWLVYDNAYALKFPRGSGEPISVIRLLPHMVGVLGQGYAVTGYRVYRTDGSFEDFPPERMLHWRRYNPEDARIGVSRLETLRQELTEDAAVQAATGEIARNGLKGNVIERPLEAPEWSAEARQRFAEEWRNRKKRSPAEDPVLEEGMKLVNQMISPKDAELLATRLATKEAVAQIYGVPVSLLTGNGDIEQDTKRFYKDVLAPVSKRLACQLDHSVCQAEYMATDRYFVFNMTEKLRGDMEARFAAQTATVGRPWRTPNEARASEDLPPHEDGDKLTIPLNVMLEGEGSPALPAPNVMPPQDPNKPEQDGSYREPQNRAIETTAKLHPELLPERLEHFYARQQRVIQRRGGGFDAERWNRELAEDLKGIVSPELIGSFVQEVNGVTEVVLSEHGSVGDAFHQLRAEAGHWALDIDRARVMIVAQGLLDVGESG